MTKLNPYSIYFAVCSANLLSFSLGASFCWPEIVIPLLESNDTSINPLRESITPVASKWLVSSQNLASFKAAILGAVGVAKIGTKKTLLLSGFQLLVSHFFCAFGTQIWYFLTARYLMGLSTGSFFVAMISYLADIAHDNKRGTFICLMTVFISFGGLFAHLVGPFVTIKQFSFVNIVTLGLYYLTFAWFVPESPYDLLKRNNINEAKKSFEFFRGGMTNDLVQEFLNIMVRVKVIVKVQNPTLLCKMMKVFSASQIFNGFLIFHQLNGMEKIIAYMQTILKFDNVNVNSITASIAAIALFCTLISAYLVDKLGRKKLLIIAFYFVAVSFFTFTTHFILNSLDYSSRDTNWIAFVSLLAMVIAHNLVSSIPWLLLTEIFSYNIRNSEIGLAAFMTFMLGFVITVLFPTIEDGVGLYGAIFILEVLLGFGFVCFLLSIPETAGKCFEEIF